MYQYLLNVLLTEIYQYLSLIEFESLMYFVNILVRLTVFKLFLILVIIVGSEVYS